MHNCGPATDKPHVEINADTIPAELGQWVIDTSVSFTKGCYTGQELVARIDSRGGNVPRHLRVVEIDGDDPVPGGTPIEAGDLGEVGLVTSAAPAPGDTGGQVALAFVKRSADDGEVAATAGGRTARILAR